MTPSMDDPLSLPEPIDHAAAHERLADLALERGGLDRLAASTAADDRALVEHLRICEACQAEVASARRLRAALGDALAALPEVRRLDLEPIAPPESLRSAVLLAARREPRLATGVNATDVPASLDTTLAGGAANDGAARPRRRSWLAVPTWSRPAWAGTIAAVLVVAILGGLGGYALERRAASDEAATMASLVATVDRVLAADPHWLVPLRTPSGAAAGSVAWSKQDFAVLTSAITAPGSDRVYRCWLEWDGTWSVIGQMDFSRTTAYWTGSVGDWATVTLEPGTRFVVTLEPADAHGATAPTTPAVLEASLSG